MKLASASGARGFWQINGTLLENQCESSIITARLLPSRERGF